MATESLLAWLLQAETPTIRYLTLRHLSAASEPEIQLARAEMNQRGPIPAILSQQTPAGSWSVDTNFYQPKYTSTHWSMLLLTELAAGPLTPGFRPGAEYMLSATLDHPLHWIDVSSHDLACFWGNLLRYSLMAGAQDDLRLDAITGLLVDTALRSEWRCRYNYNLPCAWGAARALWGLAALPPAKRSLQVEAAIQSGLSFLLDEYSLVKANYPIYEGSQVHRLWSRLSFPLFYQADILLVLRALADLEQLSQPGAGAALEWLADRRTKQGRWRGSNLFRSRTWPLGSAEEIDRWVSLQAARVLERV